MAFDRTRPFNDLPPLPPVGTALETMATLKGAIAANRALAELKGAGDLIPNQSVLIQVIGLQEAKLSSEIENIVTTNDELYRAFSDQSGSFDPQTKEVLHYSDALWYGYQNLREGGLLSTRLFEEIVYRIRQTNDGIRRGTGTVIANSRRETLYTPPHGEAIIREKLADLEKFLHADDSIDPLIKMAAMHYQFEAIHPFSDGNGRTGRILNILYLVSVGLLDLPVIYLSRYIINNKTDYYAGLRQITEEGCWEEWILFMLRAVETTALETHQRILGVRTLMQETGEQIRAALPRIYSKYLVEALFTQPYCRIKMLEEAGFGSRPTVTKYLQELTAHGFLQRIDVKREAYFLNDRFLTVLTK